MTQADWLPLGAALRLIAGIPDPALPQPGEATRFATLPDNVRAERERAAAAARDALLAALAAGRAVAWGYSVSDPSAPIDADAVRLPIPPQWWRQPDVCLVPPLGGAFIAADAAAQGGGRRPGFARLVLPREDAVRLRPDPDRGRLLAAMVAFAEAHAAEHGCPPKADTMKAQFPGRDARAILASADYPDRLRLRRGRPKERT